MRQAPLRYTGTLIETTQTVLLTRGLARGDIDYIATTGEGARLIRGRVRS